MKRRQTYVLLGLILVSSISVSIVFALSARSRQLDDLAYFNGLVVKPTGFQSSPQLDNISGSFTFISDSEILHTNDGVTSVSDKGILHIQSGHTHLVAITGDQSSPRYKVIDPKLLKVDITTGTVTKAMIRSEACPSSFYGHHYVFPRKSIDRIEGYGGPMIVSLDGKFTTRPATEAESKGDFYWEPLHAFVNKFKVSGSGLFTGEPPTSKILIPFVQPDKAYASVDLDYCSVGIVGVDSNQRLVLTWKSSVGDCGIAFGSFENDKIVVSDKRSLGQIKWQDAVISRDGTLIAFEKWVSEPSDHNLVVLDVDSMKETVVAKLTTTWINYMMFSPNNSYLALQLQNSVVWKKIK